MRAAAASAQLLLCICVGCLGVFAAERVEGVPTLVLGFGFAPEILSWLLGILLVFRVGV